MIGFRLSMTIKENLTQYLEAFSHTNDSRNKADISTFVYEFLDLIYKSYQKTEIYALQVFKSGATSTVTTEVIGLMRGSLISLRMISDRTFWTSP